MARFVGLDVSVKETSVCVVDDTGTVVCERKVPTEPDDITLLLTSVGGDAGGPVQASACKDAGGAGATDAADQSQARAAQADRHRVRHARHATQLRP